MKLLKPTLGATFALTVAMLQGCAGKPVQLGSPTPIRAQAYDMANPKKVSVTATGFQLLLFIPINVNDRQARAYAQIEKLAGDGLIGDVQIQETWQYAFVGTVYKTTIEANVYPKK